MRENQGIGDIQLPASRLVGLVSDTLFKENKFKWPRGMGGEETAPSPAGEKPKCIRSELKGSLEIIYSSPYFTVEKSRPGKGQ